MTNTKSGQRRVERGREPGARGQPDEGGMRHEAPALLLEVEVLAQLGAGSGPRDRVRLRIASVGGAAAAGL